MEGFKDVAIYGLQTLRGKMPKFARNHQATRSREISQILEHYGKRPLLELL